MPILKIAVTGSAGSGKSKVCNCFENLGVATLDCDLIARQVVEPGQAGFNEVVALFGQDVVKKDGTLDRAKLRSHIMDNPALRKEMENILHPKILDEMIRQIGEKQQKGFKAVAVEVPLLFESGMDRFFDVTIAVVGDLVQLAGRVSKRDSVSREAAEKMIKLQMPQDEKIKKADHVIENRGSVSELFESVGNCYEKIEKEYLTS